MSSPTEQRAAAIAVAPFRQPPADPAHALLASSFLEDIVAELARFPSFEVLAARTSLALSEPELQPRALAERFGVTHLLDSSVVASGDELRVLANLIETPSGRQLWSQKYAVPLRDVMTVQEDIAAHVANHLSARINMARLSRAKARPVASLEAYDCWLRGRDCLRRGTIAADAEARELFTRALSADPTYARAYAGLSLTHFNEWSCQLWQDWEVNERLAFEYACKAVDLDESDHVVHSVLGRIHMYRRNYGQARAHLDRALALSPNDADTLIQIAPWYGFFGESKRGIELVEKALRLNPLHDVSYYVLGSMPYFFARELRRGLELIEKAPPCMIVDQSAYTAAAYAHLGELPAAQKHVAMFLETFQEKITSGRAPNPDEPLAYLLHVNPFTRQEDIDYFVEGLRKAGLSGTERPSGEPYLPKRAASNARFSREGEHWVATYEGKTALVADMKGCGDIALLLASAGERIHCMELAGRALESDAGPAMDARARAQCQDRMRELRQELESAERDSDLGRAQRAREELDQLTESLERALGLFGRERKVGDPAEKARTAVTWRIRSAIKKIGESHPELGRHFEASIRTGAFCVYDPEVRVSWSI
jgi:TolB-like protein